MGLLSEGAPMEWEDMVEWQQHVRKYGVEQFIRLYNKLKVTKYTCSERIGIKICFRMTAVEA